MHIAATLILSPTPTPPSKRLPPTQINYPRLKVRARVQVQNVNTITIAIAENLE